jgi:hypothetical protein
MGMPFERPESGTESDLPLCRHFLIRQEENAMLPEQLLERPDPLLFEVVDPHTPYFSAQRPRQARHLKVLRCCHFPLSPELSADSLNSVKSGRLVAVTFLEFLAASAVAGIIPPDLRL